MAENGKNQNMKPAANPRMTAYRVLMRVEESGGYSNISLNSALEASSLDTRDKAFATKLVYGVLENTVYLDCIIDSCSRVKANKLEAEVRCLLRMALYQMTFLETPDSAAVNETVNLAKKLKLFRATGFINGLLRGFIRNGKQVKLPDRKKDELKYFCVKYSCPMWLVKLWQKSYGSEICESILESLSERPPIFARVNTTKITDQRLAEELKQEGISADISDVLPDCLVLSDTGSLKENSQYKRGEFHVQDGSSQLCCTIAAPKSGDKVYDVCAAPGGKSFTLAEIMDNKGEVVSCDLHPHRVKLIAEGAQRLGLDCIKPSVRDALAEDENADCDLVLCDVPCSGLGIIRRKPEIRQKSESEIAQLPELQYKILTSSSRLVKKGGRLVYSTCTLNPAENASVIEKFLDEHNDFEPCSIILPNGAEFKRLIDEPDYQFTVFPMTANTDGFFISIIKRKD